MANNFRAGIILIILLGAWSTHAVSLRQHCEAALVSSLNQVEVHAVKLFPGLRPDVVDSTFRRLSVFASRYPDDETNIYDKEDVRLRKVIETYLQDLGYTPKELHYESRDRHHFGGWILGHDRLKIVNPYLGRIIPEHVKIVTAPVQNAFSSGSAMYHPRLVAIYPPIEFLENPRGEDSVRQVFHELVHHLIAVAETQQDTLIFSPKAELFDDFQEGLKKYFNNFYTKSYSSEEIATFLATMGLAMDCHALSGAKLSSSVQADLEMVLNLLEGHLEFYYPRIIADLDKLYEGPIASHAMPTYHFLNFPEKPAQFVVSGKAREIYLRNKPAFIASLRTVLDQERLHFLRLRELLAGTKENTNLLMEKREEVWQWLTSIGLNIQPLRPSADECRQNILNRFPGN